MSMETCQRCGEKDEDRRTLWMACFYAMNELGLPFEENEVSKDHAKFFTLRVCKDCRAAWMGAIKKWFYDKPVKESFGSGIFVRRNGANVEISEEEWLEENPGRQPAKVRIK